MTATLPQRRVLLAEDDAEMRWLVARALRRDGYEVIELDSGDALYREITGRLMKDSSLGVDLIVTDIRMPGQNGLELVELLRRAEIDVPLIMMTAFGDDETAERAAAAGAVLFDKPFDMNDLRTAAGLLVLAGR